MVSDPTAAVSAAPDPDTPAKIMLARTAARQMPPRTRPTRATANFTRRSEIPPRSINSPARMKYGTAINGKESTMMNMRCGVTTSGIGAAPGSRP